MQEENKVQTEPASKTELLKEMVELSRDLQRISSYLINGQCIQAYRHAIQLKPMLGSKSEPKQALEAMIRYIYDGRQVQAEAELKRLSDMIRAAYEDVLSNLKSEPKTDEKPSV